MKTLFLILQAQAQGQQAPVGGGASMWILLLLMFVVMYFFMIRPQQKKQKELQNFRKSIEKGQEVVTAGGIYGTVRDIDDVNNILIIEVANGVRLRVDRNSVFGSATGTDNYSK